MSREKSRWSSALMRVVFLFCVALLSAAAGPLEAGRSAYEQQDFATAMEMLKPLAEQGNAEAQFLVGEMAYGTIEFLNKEEALRWYRRAAEQGYAPAQSIMGFLLDYGGDVPENKDEAARWYRLAAEQGEASSQLALGYIYETGLSGLGQDYAEAARWYLLAAEQRNMSAQYALGVLYRYGDGVPVDTVKSYFWFLLASHKYHPEILPELDDAASKLSQLNASAEQIAEAERQAAKWSAAHPPR